MQAILTALFGPVFTKEMLELARRRRYFLVRSIYGIGIFFVLLITFQSYNFQRLNQTGGANIHFMAEFAETMFRSVGITQFIALFAFVPMFLCGAIASEREEQTLDLLFTTTLQDREIILGKMFSRLVIFALLILMALPIFGLISLFGGISPPALFRLGAAMLTALIYTGAYSIYYSTITRSPMGALIRTYWQLGLRLLALPMVVMFLLELLGRNYARELLPYVACFLCCTNPLMPLMMAVIPEMYAEIGAQAARFGWLIGNWFFPLLLVIPLLRAWILTRRATRRLRLTPAVVRSKIFGILPIRKYRLAFVNRLTAPFRGLGSPERLLHIVPVRNPLWLRARQCHCFDREGHLGRLQGWAWVVAAVFLLLIGLAEYIHGHKVLRDPDMVVGFLPITYTALAIFSTIVASTSVVGDRRRGFFDLLLTTPLTGREVVDGNFLSVWAHVNRLLCLPFALALLFRYTEASKFVDLATSLAMAVSYMAVIALAGIACSLCARSLAGALVPTFVFVLVPNIGIAFLMPIFMRYAPIVLWFLNLTGLIVASYWVRRKTTPAAVGFYLLFVYQCLVTGAASWIAWKDTPHGEHLVTASMPSVLAFTVLSVHRPPIDRLPYANWIRPCHLLATLVFCLWARWWVIAHFESLVGRASSRARRPGSLALGISATVQFFYWHIPETLRPRWRGKPKAGPQAVEPVLSDGG